MLDTWEDGQGGHSSGDSCSLLVVGSLMMRGEGARQAGCRQVSFKNRRQANSQRWGGHASCRWHTCGGGRRLAYKPTWKYRQVPNRACAVGERLNAQGFQGRGLYLV